MSGVDGGSNTKSNGYAISVPNPGGATLTFDANGNMTSDGTNSYAWDCENRLIKIVYPGSGNYSALVYDGLGRNVLIQEYTSSSLTNTRQFVWARDTFRPYQPCEARDSSSTITAQYFTSGEILSRTSYFYTADHLANSPQFASRFSQLATGTGLVFSPTFTSSIREMTNGSGTVEAQLSYDLYGRVSQLQGSLSPDFQFGDYYLHPRSGLSLTRTRAYSSSQGRFINRDSIGERGGPNLYAYMMNHPEIGVDPSGNCAIAIGVGIAILAGATLAGSTGPGSNPSGSGQGQQNGRPINCQPTDPDCDPDFSKLKNKQECQLFCSRNCTKPGDDEKRVECLQQCWDHKWPKELQDGARQPRNYFGP